MATEKERKLQIEPIVQESVMHNARVSPLLASFPPSSRRLQFDSLTYIIVPGPINNPLPHLLPLRHRFRHPRARILLRLHLLLPGYRFRIPPDLAPACRGTAKPPRKAAAE